MLAKLIHFSNADWNFPSPNATPTNCTFAQHGFQTPKTATLPSHFQDAFTTPQVPGYVTPQQPQSMSMTPVQRPQSSSETLRSNFYAGMQAGMTQGVPFSQAQIYAPPIASQGQTMDFQPSPVHTQRMQQFIEQQQMQTPPPTRGTSAKKAQQPSQVAFGTPSTIASRRFVTPQQQVQVHPVTQGPYTPMQYPHLQFSPDMTQFSNFGPASAPVMPQTQLFWDQARSPMSAIPQQRPLEDPFAPSMQPAMAWPAASPAMPHVSSMSFETPAMVSFPVQPPHPRPSSAASLSAGFVGNNMAPTVSASLDPSLIYSSPVQSISRSANKQVKSKREQPLAKRKDSAQDFKSSISPQDPQVAIPGSGLRRSNTLGAARPGTAQSAISMPESFGRSVSGQNLPRTASPLKRVGRMPLRAISEHKPQQRPSVILTVDENGIARTETRHAAESSPTKSIRDRYPGLFDSDSSGEESEDEIQPLVRSASFSFAKGQERRSKAARLDPPIENLEGLSIPRSNSALSVRGVTPSRAAVAAAAQLRRQGSLRRTSRSSAGKRNNMSASTGSLIDSSPMDMSTEPAEATAGAEATGLPMWPPQPSLRSSSRTLDEHNRRWSMMSFDQHSLPSTSQSNRSGIHRAPSIRCVCSMTEDHGSPLVQCSSCTQWLHAACLGLANFQLPESYTCFLCTKPASRVR